MVAQAVKALRNATGLIHPLANMPIQRFGSQLISKNQFVVPYMNLLKSAQREENLTAVMRRNLLSVDWEGYVYGCDFNQMLDLSLDAGGPGSAASIIVKPKCEHGDPFIHSVRLEHYADGRPSTVGTFAGQAAVRSWIWREDRTR